MLLYRSVSQPPPLSDIHTQTDRQIILSHLLTLLFMNFIFYLRYLLYYHTKRNNFKISTSIDCIDIKSNKKTRTARESSRTAVRASDLRHPPPPPRGRDALQGCDRRPLLFFYRQRSFFILRQIEIEDKPIAILLFSMITLICSYWHRAKS